MKFATGILAMSGDLHIPVKRQCIDNRFESEGNRHGGHICKSRLFHDVKLRRLITGIWFGGDRLDGKTGMTVLLPEGQR